MVILFFAIVISGANKSHYKFIFLFIITSTTIQYGMKSGIVTSIVESLDILVMGILYMPGASVNKCF